MITTFDQDQATFILPLTADMDDYSSWDQLNMNLGDSVLVEVDYDTENYIKLDVDYSLREYDDLNDAKHEVDLIYAYVKEYFDVDGDIDQGQWQTESTAYLVDSVKETIEAHQEYLDKLLSEGPGVLNTSHTWANEDEANSQDNIEVLNPIRKNVKGQVWAAVTKKRWDTIAVFNERVQKYTDEISVNTNELNNLMVQA